MKSTHITVALCAFIVAGCMRTATRGGASAENPSAHEPVQAVTLENLLSSRLEGVESTEVVVSRVTIPPHTTLPKHWHPGEEFAYILSGSVTLWQEGKADVTGKPGDVVKVPLKQVHTAVTAEEGVELLIFRVHEQGEPERVSAE